MSANKDKIRSAIQVLFSVKSLSDAERRKQEAAHPPYEARQLEQSLVGGVIKDSGTKFTLDNSSELSDKRRDWLWSAFSRKRSSSAVNGSSGYIVEEVGPHNVEYADKVVTGTCNSRRVDFLLFWFL